MTENMTNDVEIEAAVIEKKPQQQEPVKAVRPAAKTGRPEILTLTAVYHFVLAIPELLIALIILVVPIPVVIATVRDTAGLTWSLIGLGLGFMFFLIPGIVLLLTGIGLVKGWNWTRWLAVCPGYSGFAGFPFWDTYRGTGHCLSVER